MITQQKIKEENIKLTKLYKEYQNNPTKGMIDKEIFDLFIFKAINSTLAWCANVTKEAPSDWILNSLNRWNKELKF